MTARKLLRLALLALALTALPDVAAAGPWVPAEGQRYIQLSSGFMGTNGREQYQANLYTELGLGEDFAFVGSLPVTWAKQEPELGRFFAVDPTLGFRYGLLDGPLVVSTQADLTLPVTGTANLTGQLLAGSGFPIGSWTSGYWHAGGGLRARSGDAPAEAVFNLDAGLWLAEPILFQGGILGRVQLGEEQGRTPQHDYRVGGQLLFRSSPTLDYGVDIRHTLDARGISPGWLGTFYVAFNGRAQ